MKLFEFLLHKVNVYIPFILKGSFGTVDFKLMLTCKVIPNDFKAEFVHQKYKHITNMYI